MLSTIQNHWNQGVKWATGKYQQLPTFDAFLHQKVEQVKRVSWDFYQASQKTASQKFNQGVVWIKNGTPLLIAAGKRQAWNVMVMGKNFAWNYRKELVGSLVVGGVGLYLYRLWKNLPEKPLVSMVTSLNHAQLRVEKPKGEPLPPVATLIFCIDTSGSMETPERSGAVKEALNTLLDDAQRLIDQTPGAAIYIEIIGFNDSARIITPLTQLGTKTILESVKTQIRGTLFGGGTAILSGLRKATEKLETKGMGSRTVILLTDGDDNGCNAASLSQIQVKLTQAKASIFGIGIGAQHNKDTLRTITAGGTYIDTTVKDGPTIQSSIAAIYKRAIAPFTELRLTTAQLEAGSWSVRGTEGEVVDLGGLEEGKVLQEHIVIYGDRLNESVDLATVTFRLTFKDPQGKEGTVLLPWNPGTIVDPSVIRR